MYIGSVRFFKHLIILVIALVIIVPLTIVILSFTGGDRDLRGWSTHQLGQITTPVPSAEVSEAMVVEGDVEITSFSSSTPDANVLVERFVDFILHLRSQEVSEDLIETVVLRGAARSVVNDIVGGGGELFGERMGEFGEILYFSMYGMTNVADESFDVRVFLHDTDFYLITLTWNSEIGDIGEQFFRNVQFAE